MNSYRLVTLRQARGWTQRQLAGATGLSERLIAKAESGATISGRSLQLLAEALSTESQSVSASDLMLSVTDMAREFIQIMYRHQAETISHAAHLLDPDLGFRIWGESAGLPFAGTYYGLEAVAGLFRQFFSLIESPPDHDPLTSYSFYLDQDVVVVWGESHLFPKGHPGAAPMPISYLFRFKDDRIVYIEDRFDTTHGGQLLGTLPPAIPVSETGALTNGPPMLSADVPGGKQPQPHLDTAHERLTRQPHVE